MTKPGWLFLCLSIVSSVMGMSADSPDAQTTAFIGTGVSASLLLLTLILGRRIKFDPVLR